MVTGYFTKRYVFVIFDLYQRYGFLHDREHALQCYYYL